MKRKRKPPTTAELIRQGNQILRALGSAPESVMPSLDQEIVMSKRRQQRRSGRLSPERGEE